jgi:hypothetical protein
MKFLKEELLAEENGRPAMPWPLRNWSRGASTSLPALQSLLRWGWHNKLWKFSMQTTVRGYKNEKIGFLQVLPTAIPYLHQVWSIFYSIQLNFMPMFYCVIERRSFFICIKLTVL